LAGVFCHIGQHKAAENDAKRIAWILVRNLRLR
jgi:hypothetical protein